MMRQGSGGNGSRALSAGDDSLDEVLSAPSASTSLDAQLARSENGGGGGGGGAGGGGAARAVSFTDVTDVEAATTVGAAATGAPAGADGAGGADSLMPPKRPSLVDAERSGKLASKEAKAAERQEANQRRQADALIMFRNIPFVEANVLHAVQIKPGQQEGGGGGGGGGSKGSHVAYEVTMGVPKDAYKHATHTVCHRYSRFAALHEALTKAWGDKVALPKLPKKVFSFGGLSTRQIEERREGLEDYLQQLVTVLNWSVEPNLRAFLECDRWLRERKTRIVS